MEVTSDGLARFFGVVLPHLNEVQRRVVAGASAEMLGRGGKSWVAEASGMSRNTVIKAEGEVAAGGRAAGPVAGVGCRGETVDRAPAGPVGSVGSVASSRHAGQPDVVAEMDIEIDSETCERTGPSRVHDL